jgi:hypothetical protein
MQFTRLAYEDGRKRWKILANDLKLTQDGRELPEWDELPPRLQDAS